MPIYEYECSECSQRFEKKQRFHDDPVAECPRCQSKSKRIMSPSGIIFKGSGFYVNDYPKSSDKSPTRSTIPDAKKEDKSPKETSSPKTESAPTASKTEVKAADKPAPAKDK
jgi:putative FmdB family regulatory protein